MFDSIAELPAVRTADLAGLIEQNHAELLSAECRMLQLACAWADAHYLDSGSEEYQPSEREPESDVEPDDHRSLSMAPPPAFDPKAARPRVVLHFHLSAAALGAIMRWSGARRAAR